MPLGSACHRKSRARRRGVDVSDIGGGTGSSRHAQARPSPGASGRPRRRPEPVAEGTVMGLAFSGIVVHFASHHLGGRCREERRITGGAYEGITQVERRR